LKLKRILRNQKKWKKKHAQLAGTHYARTQKKYWEEREQRQLEKRLAVVEEMFLKPGLI
jgi:hypothetical protein